VIVPPNQRYITMLLILCVVIVVVVFIFIYLLLLRIMSKTGLPYIEVSFFFEAEGL